VVEILMWLEEDFQKISWISQAMKLLGFIGYHKACEQRHNVTTMKVRNTAKQ